MTSARDDRTVPSIPRWRSRQAGPNRHHRFHDMTRTVAAESTADLIM
jgi:hypothetical protein